MPPETEAPGGRLRAGVVRQAFEVRKAPGPATAASAHQARFVSEADVARRRLAGLRAHTDRPVFVHGAVAPLTDAYREDGVEMLPTLPVGEHKGSFSGELVVAPPSASRSVPTPCGA